MYALAPREELEAALFPLGDNTGSSTEWDMKSVQGEEWKWLKF